MTTRNQQLIIVYVVHLNISNQYSRTDGDKRGTVYIERSVFCRFVARYELASSSPLDILTIM